jgi:hypothetical protein
MNRPASVYTIYRTISSAHCLNPEPISHSVSDVTYWCCPPPQPWILDPNLSPGLRSSTRSALCQSQLRMPPCLKTRKPALCRANAAKKDPTISAARSHIQNNDCATQRILTLETLYIILRTLHPIPTCGLRDSRSRPACRSLCRANT